MSPARPLRGIGILCLLQFMFAAVPSPSATILGEPPLDLNEFKTPGTAATIGIGGLASLSPEHMGYLGVRSDTNADGRLVVKAVAPDSPAFRAGVETNDVISKFDGQTVASADALRELIQTNAPGQSVTLSLLRGGEPKELTVKLASLGAVGRPLERIRLGVTVGEVLMHGGFPVEEVDANSTGARAGIRQGDVIFKINGTKLQDTRSLADALENMPGDDIATLTLLRNDNEVEVRARLLPSDAPDRPADYFGRRGFGARAFNNRLGRDALRVAIVGIEFPDMKHNAFITAADWEREFFSTNIFTGPNPTGQAAHGSINDYYLEQSSGAMRVTGKMLDWVQVSKNREDYLLATSTNGDHSDDGIVLGGPWTSQDAPLLTEALDKLVERDGRNVLSNYDAVVFLYAGRPLARDESAVFWPHTTLMMFDYRRLRYVVSFEGGERMSDISILCHELGHVMGLPDLYVRRPQNAGASSTTSSNSPSGRRGGFFGFNPNPYVETLANWDLMAVQVGQGRPQHLSAWSKEQLGWLKPVVINPLVPQKLVLAPVEKSTNQCFKIPLRPDGSEYLLLENRRKIGFDESVPAEGLLIWRVVYGRPVLEEAHGFTGANAARVDVRRIPFPTDRNNSFTPYSRPSSAAFTGAGLPVYLTDIHRLPDGRISFEIGNGFY